MPEFLKKVNFPGNFWAKKGTFKVETHLFLAKGEDQGEVSGELSGSGHSGQIVL